MIKAVIFDMFGVLIEDGVKVMREELRKDYPKKADEAERVLHASHHGTISSGESRRKTAKIFGLTVAEYLVAANANTKNTELLNYILGLKTRGYETAVLSNTSPGGIGRRFGETEQTLYFDAVIASGDVGWAKPEVQIYEIAADKLGVRFDECIFTDDNPEYCEAARKVGMQAVLYKNFKQLKQDLTKLLKS